MKRPAQESMSIHAINIKNVQHQKPQHEQTYLRVKKEIEDLYLELSDDDLYFFVIEKSKLRKVLRIIYFLPHQQIIQKRRQTTKYWSIDNQINTQLSFMAKFPEKEEIEECEVNNMKGFDSERFVIFTCIIEYNIYPFSPPYIFMTADNGLATTFGQNDFRNIIRDLFEDIDWFPIYGLFDIFIKIPYFISKYVISLKSRLNNKNSMMRSSYYHPNPFTRSDIQRFVFGLKVYDGEFYDSKDALIGKYLKKVIGISSNHLIIFNRQDFNQLTIHRTFKLKEIKVVKIEQNQKRIKFILKFSNKQEICYKFIKNQRPDNLRQIMSSQEVGRKEQFLNWMRICLLNCELQKQNNKYMNVQDQSKDKSIKQITFQDHKVQNIEKLSNQSIFFTNLKPIGQNEEVSKKQSSSQHQNLIQRQELMSKILETLDLLLALPKYKKYQTKFSLDDIQQISYEKQQKEQNQFNFDLIKLEYQKLKEYNNFIENQRKKIFKMI